MYNACRQNTIVRELEILYLCSGVFTLNIYKERHSSYDAMAKYLILTCTLLIFQHNIRKNVRKQARGA